MEAFLLFDSDVPADLALRWREELSAPSAFFGGVSLDAALVLLWWLPLLFVVAVAVVVVCCCYFSSCLSFFQLFHGKIKKSC